MRAVFYHTESGVCFAEVSGWTAPPRSRQQQCRAEPAGDGGEQPVVEEHQPAGLAQPDPGYGFAQESTNLAKNQVLSQAAQAMLARAGQWVQQVTQLPQESGAAIPNHLGARKGGCAGKALPLFSFVCTVYAPPPACYRAPSSARSGGRVVEGARLESVYGSKAHRGFESLPLRQVFLISMDFNDGGNFSPIFRGFARSKSPEPAL